MVFGLLNKKKFLMQFIKLQKEYENVIESRKAIIKEACCKSGIYLWLKISSPPSPPTGGGKGGEVGSFSGQLD